MAKLQSATAIKRKTKHGITTIFQRFFEIWSVEDRSRSGRLTVINQKVDEVNDFLQTHPGSGVGSVVEASSIP